MARYESGTATIAVPDSYESWTGRIWDHHTANGFASLKEECNYRFCAFFLPFLDPPLATRVRFGKC